MKKVNNKKGFTLAELLVVLAIMAILVAIAVPLFTGAIGDANEKVVAANKRALKSAALIQVMNDTSGTLSKEGPWNATCEIAADGTMGEITIKDGAATAEKSGNPAGEYVVTVEKVDIKTGS